ncbi:MAG: hypothetical protein KF815_03195 [Rhodospirillales bacterium]|nr:hypothetical protein [Rhodospirillales bacterium]MDG4602061.1 hypothetical protein [Defluviicoccus sp.]MDG4608004.1 hypothetical protein [Defluviicoccus sp.]
MAAHESDQAEPVAQAAQGYLNDRLVALAALGALLFHPLFVGLFDAPVLVMGIPLLFLYLFGVWVLLIIALAVTTETAPAATIERDDIGSGSF